MGRKILRLFRELHERPYIDSEFDNHVLMQKSIYILECMGLDIGDFFFQWDQHGPYSVELSNLVQEELAQTEENEMLFSTYAKDAITQTKALIERGIELDCAVLSWMELVGSVHYLSKSVFIPGGDIIGELMSRKPQFSDMEINNAALLAVEVIDELGYYNDNEFATRCRARAAS